MGAPETIRAPDSVLQRKPSVEEKNAKKVVDAGNHAAIMRNTSAATAKRVARLGWRKRFLRAEEKKSLTLARRAISFLKLFDGLRVCRFFEKLVEQQRAVAPSR